ncbi:hypothetical protein JCM8547_005084 [Rhodosporidiobolus lusitaniae]
MAPSFSLALASVLLALPPTRSTVSIAGSELGAVQSRCVGLKSAGTGIASPGYQSDSSAPVGAVCVAAAGGWFCGAKGATCTSNIQCDNGRCQNGIYVGAFGDTCSIDTDCLGYIFCLDAGFAPTVSGTCGSLGFPTGLTNQQTLDRFGHACESGYCASEAGLTTTEISTTATETSESSTAESTTRSSIEASTSATDTSTSTATSTASSTASDASSTATETSESSTTESTATSTTETSSSSTETSSSTATAIPTSTKFSSVDWNYVGCYTDSVSSRTLLNGLGSSTWTAENCLSLATAKGYKYAGVIYGGECWGANEISPSGSVQDDSACNWLCADRSKEEGAANVTLTCGGEAGLDVYESTLPTSTSTVPTEAPSATAAAPTKAKNADWDYAGCWSDLQNARSLQNHLDTAPRTAETYLTAAANAGYPVTGIISGGECWGGDALKSFATVEPASKCEWTCNNDENTYCGGASSLDVYIVKEKLLDNPDWIYTGCYTDSISARTLVDGLGSTHWDIQTCLDLAAGEDYQYAGIIYGGECWGANEIASTGKKQPVSECMWDCNDARGTETCGGEKGLDVYQLS